MRQLPPKARNRLLAEAAQAAAQRADSAALGPVWQPQPGKQALAYDCDADVIGYGGAAGAGKTDLALGLAGTKHRRAIILRREFPQVRGMIERSREIFNADNRAHGRDSYNESLHIWRLADGRFIEFGSCQYEKDKEDYRGRPYDLHVFDEATQFSESMVRFISAWNRTTTAGQRCQILLTFNPPTDEQGRWVIRYFLPWMAHLFPDLPECAGYAGAPAAPGELRYFITVDGRDTECDAGTPNARSRTFIPGSVEDNRYLMEQGYDATLEALPEPLRSQMRYGSFTAGIAEDPWQAIPAEWVRLAQRRWRERPRPEGAPDAVGVDVAHGGADATTITRLYGAYGTQERHAGKTTPRGSAVAALLERDIADESPIGVDVIGYGASAFDTLADLDVDVIAVDFGASAPAGARDRSGKLGFRNLRAYCYWQLRESLDPESGDDLALPDDDALRADLCAPRWALTPQGIQLESKDDIKKRLGRSPDAGDSYTIAHYVQKHHGGSWLLFGGE